MRTLVKKLLANESGATAIEYALIAALISIAAVGAMTTLGGKITSTLTAASNKLP